ncbi:MAG: hypothetical protein QM608_03795 [Caulobacter sp.]
MRVTMRIFWGYPDTKAVGETVDAFAPLLTADCETAPPFEHIDELSIAFGVDHPASSTPRKSSGSFSRADRTFIAGAGLDYDAWIGDRWLDRVEAVAVGARAALAAVHKTRITPAERDALAAAVDRAAVALKAQPPATLASLKPIYVHATAEGGIQSIGFMPPPAAMAALVSHAPVEVQPADIAAYLARFSPAEEPVATIKLHKRVEGRLHYREAWVDGETVVEHFGPCGERGEVVEHPAADARAQRKIVERIAAAARADGFKAVPDSRMAGLLVSVPIDGMGSVEDLDRCHALEDFLDEVTGWLGLGHCDGGSSGSGSMEAFCLVVDYRLAAEVIGRELAASPFADFVVSREPR